MGKFIDRTGSSISGYEVLGLDGWRDTKDRRRPAWRFRCSCGTEFVAFAEHVSIGGRTCPTCRPRGRFAPDLTGQRFGKLTVLSKVGSKKVGNGQTAIWKVKCTVCSAVFERLTPKLKNIEICPCRKRHGATSTDEPQGPFRRTYRIWTGMHSRCRDKSCPMFHRYGGRGITVCERWKSFETFLDDMGMAPEGMSIERMDNDGNYTPGNCTWATPAEQSRNRTGIHKIEWNGQTKCLKDWATELGINYATLRFRLIRQGWSVDDAFTWKKGKMRANRRERERNEKGQYISD